MRKSTLILTLTLTFLGCNPSSDQKEITKYNGPIIDMHFHAENELSPEPMALCLPLSTIVQHFDPKDNFGEVFWGKSANPDCEDPRWSPTSYEEYLERIRNQIEKHQLTAVVSGSVPATEKLINHFPDNLIRGLQFRVNGDSIPVDSLRVLVKEHGVKVFGEISNQYGGIAPDDPAMDPYYALAQELDIPLLYHMGSGLPGTPLFLSPDYRVALTNPILLEEVLNKYPKMRIAVAHYGEPFIDEMIAMMYHYPQLYVDLGGIQWCYPREYFYESHLKKLINAGYGKRIIFGSDMIIWPEIIDESVDIINEADFLTFEQKADIFYNNAARFLRLE